MNTTLRTYTARASEMLKIVTGNGETRVMYQRLMWFLIGVAVSSIFWIAVMRGIGNEWLDMLLYAR